MEYQESKKFAEFSDTVFCIIGYIDSNDSIHHIHHKVVTFDEYRETQDCNHRTFFPMQTHKLWRLYVGKWEYENSILTQDRLTKEDFENLECFINKKFPRPRWKKKNDDWNDAGRPRGKELDKFDEEWDKNNPV